MIASRTWGTLSSIFWAIVAVVRPLAPLLTRLVIGHAFFQTGLGKLMNLSDIADYFGTLGIPFPTANAVFISTIEFTGGIALMLGIGTNLFASLLSCTLVVALMTAERENLVGAITGSGDKTFTDILPMIFLMPTVWLVAYGAGPISLDYVISRFVLHRETAPALRKAAA
jgi:putative oxidoreductase